MGHDYQRTCMSDEWRGVAWRADAHSAPLNARSHVQDPSASRHVGGHGRRSSRALLPTDSAYLQRLPRQEPCVALTNNYGILLTESVILKFRKYV